MRLAARILWRGIRLVLHILLGAFLTLLTARRDGAGGYRYHRGLVSWWHDRLLLILAVEVQAVGDLPSAPALLVSNHVSWLDIPVLGSLTQSNFLSKDEVRRWPVIGWLAAACGTFFIRRGAGEANSIAEQIAAHLAADGLLTLFPEGTTTDGSEVRPFFPRLFAAAIQTGAPVVPVALRYHVNGRLDTEAAYTGDQHLLTNLWIILSRPHTAVQVTYTPALQLGDVERKAAAEQARGQIIKALDTQRRLPVDHTERHQAG